MDVLQQGQKQRQQPQTPTDEPPLAANDGEQGGQRWSGQRQVALQGHQGQEEGAAVEVDHVDEVGDLAEEAAPQPNLVQGHLHHEERLDDDHHQV